MNIIAIGFNLTSDYAARDGRLDGEYRWVFQDELVEWVERTTKLFPTPRRGA